MPCGNSACLHIPPILLPSLPFSDDAFWLHHFSAAAAALNHKVAVEH